MAPVPLDPPVRQPVPGKPHHTRRWVTGMFPGRERYAWVVVGYGPHPVICPRDWTPAGFTLGSSEAPQAR